MDPKGIMETILIVWLVIALLIFAGHVFYVGYDRDLHVPEREFILTQGLIISLFWPFAIAGACVIGPFLGIYYLGKHLGR